MPFTPTHTACAASSVFILQLSSLLPHIPSRAEGDGTDSKGVKNMHRRPGKCELLLREVGCYCTAANTQFLHVGLPMYIYSDGKIHLCGSPGDRRVAAIP